MQLKYEEDSATFSVTEDTFDKVEAEYMYLTKPPGWKEDIDGGDDTSSEDESNTRGTLYRVLSQGSRTGSYGNSLFC